MTQGSDSSSPPGSASNSAATGNTTPHLDLSAGLTAGSSPGDGGVLRPFVNERLNSRLAESLPSGAMRIRWQKDLSLGMNPIFLLQFGDRILAQGTDLWELFDLTGKSIQVAELARSSVVLDPTNALFYLARPDGTIAGRKLTDGTPAFILPVLFGPHFERSFLARLGQRFLVVSIERPISPHSDRQPNLSLIEVQDFGNPPVTDDLGFLTSAQRTASQDYKTTLLKAALHGERITFATPENLYISDLSLKARSILHEKFEPIAISLDEDGNIYLLVEAEGRKALWRVSAQGGRQMTFLIPRDMQVSAIPPIVGRNHRAYILGTNRVLAIDPDGKLAWVRPLKSAQAAAVITNDDQLLVADGSELTAFDATGERRTLHSFAGELLATPPAITKRGEILVASQRRLYSLTP
jgi:PQQ-like domain